MRARLVREAGAAFGAVAAAFAFGLFLLAPRAGPFARRAEPPPAAAPREPPPPVCPDGLSAASWEALSGGERRALAAAADTLRRPAVFGRQRPGLREEERSVLARAWPELSAVPAYREGMLRLAREEGLDVFCTFAAVPPRDRAGLAAEFVLAEGPAGAEWRPQRAFSIALRLRAGNEDELSGEEREFVRAHPNLFGRVPVSPR
jgi:hypothetical protein